MTLDFHKFQATGNDFILIDNRGNEFKPDQKEIKSLCDRKFGIGSDGLILIQNHSSLDFDMIFYNPDGSMSFCGNGSRCAVSFFNELADEKKKNYSFNAIDGEHQGNIHAGQSVSVTMADSEIPEKIKINDAYFLDTGSPHYVEFTNSLDFDIISRSRPIRNNYEVFGNKGTNVNFVQIIEEGSIFVRTYERGVEDETLSCGTGVTASSIIYSYVHNISSPISVKTHGGDLSVIFDKSDTGFTKIELQGPAKKVFTGKIDLE